MTDDEKFLWKDLSLEEANKLAYQNIKVILIQSSVP
jgi:tryptophanyl-tRNA synthetase